MLNVTRGWKSGELNRLGGLPFPDSNRGRGARQATHAGAACAMMLPVLAQAQKTAAEAPASGEGGAWPVIDWLLVAVLVCGALFMVCRSSRRN